MDERIIRIAIFEDNEDYRKGIASIIDSSPPFCVVGSFSNCQKLKSRVADCKPDIILMDISMPRISGIEAVKLISGFLPGVPILMQTVFEDEEKIFASICAGASGYILKSDGPGKLLEAMMQIYLGGSAFTPVIARKILTMVKEQGGASEPEFFDLTAREKEILQFLIKGLSYKGIASAAGISIETVHSHIKKIYEKLHVHSMSGAVAKAIKNKIA